MLVNKSDLEAANSSKSISNLTKDKEDAQAIIGAIQDFISTSKDVLIGDSFDAIRNQLNNYSILMNTRIRAADSLIEAIKQANDSLATYMEGESKLDTDDYETFKAEYDSACRAVESLTSQINNYDYDNATVSLESLRNARRAAEEKAKKYKHLMELLEGLPGADGTAYGILTGGAEDSNTLTSQVGDIVTIKM